MQLVSGGPDLPSALLQAQEEGRLAFFCGAGVSMPMLPGFRELVEKLHEAFPGEDPDAATPDTEALDLVLTRLEKRVGPEPLRSSVEARLKTAPSYTSPTHEALIALATDRSGKLRLVTTNFDLLFERSVPAVSTKVAVAPRLPIPKPNKWNALVHLHGAIEDPNDPNHVGLVLTSGDFGAAYLTEAWASRFVTELFRHFTVLFVGYSVEDPVMRYLVDAIAAERRSGGAFFPAYSLVGVGPEDVDGSRTGWKAKGIEPLIYDNSDGHKALRSSLSSWAELWVGKLGTRIAVVTELAHFPPSALQPEDRSRFLWAVTDREGVGAQQLVALRRAALRDAGAPSPDPAWLRLLEQHTIEVPEPESNPAGTDTTAEPAGEASRPKLLASLVAQVAGALDGVQLSRLEQVLANFIAVSLDQRAVAVWVCERGGVLHPSLRQSIILEMQERRKEQTWEQVHPTLRKFWCALTCGFEIGQVDLVIQSMQLPSLLDEVGVNPLTKRAFVNAMRPRVVITAPLYGGLSFQSAQGADYQLGQLGNFRCRLALEFAREVLVESLRESAHWADLLRACHDELVVQLVEGVEVSKAFEVFGHEQDLSEHSGLEDALIIHDLESSGLGLLRETVLQAAMAIEEESPEQFRRVVATWRSSSRALLRGMALEALAASVSCTADEATAPLLEGSGSLLWEAGTKRAALQLLQRRFSECSRSMQMQLFEAVRRWRPSEVEYGDAAEELREQRDWEVGSVLNGLVSSSADTAALIAGELTAIHARRPAWDGGQLSDRGAQESVLAINRLMEAAQRLGDESSRAAVVHALADEATRTRESLHAWQEIAEANPERWMPVALSLLMRQTGVAVLVNAAWSVVAAAASTPETAAIAIAALEQLNDSGLPPSVTGRQLADVFRLLRRRADWEQHPKLLQLWDEALRRTLSGTALTEGGS